MNIGEGYSKEIQDIHASKAVTEALLVHGTAFASYPGASILSDTAKAMKASPMGHIRKGLPPFLIMHGTADALVSPVQSRQLYDALKKADNDVSYVEVEDGMATCTGFSSLSSTAWLDGLRRNLQKNNIFVN